MIEILFISIEVTISVACLLFFLVAMSAPRDNTAFPRLGLGVLIGSLLMGITAFTLARGTVPDLDTDVDYEKVEVWRSKKSVQIEVNRTLFIKAYLYKQECAQLKDGCPEKWPEKFKLVSDGSDKLILLPLKIKKTRGEKRKKVKKLRWVRIHRSFSFVG